MMMVKAFIPQVERAFNFWGTGHFVPPSGHVNPFSEELWGARTQYYVEELANLPDSRWEAIMQAAHKIVNRWRAVARARTSALPARDTIELDLEYSDGDGHYTDE